MAGGAMCECNVEVCRRQLFCKNSRAASRDTVDSQNYTYVYGEINLCETHTLLVFFISNTYLVYLNQWF